MTTTCSTRSRPRRSPAAGTPGTAASTGAPPPPPPPWKHRYKGKRHHLSSRLVRNSVVLVVLAVFGMALLWTYLVEPNSETGAYTYSELLQDAARNKGKAVDQDGSTLG